MCLAVPGLIVDIHKDEAGLFTMATVDFCGVRREVCVDTIADAAPGAYVIVHAGVAISVMNPDEAMATIDDLNRMTDYRESITACHE